VPVPRRFDRRPPERDTTRINERIRVPEVRLIDDEGQQIGVLKTADALTFAQERDLDLVEVAPEARPPVCRVLDYSKYKYEQAQKVKQARKHQQQITIREIKFRPKIAEHDYDTKKHHVERFLRHKDKVKVTIMFRGREVTHPERGTAILDRLAEELAELGVVEQRPMQEGRNMTMMMAPSKAVLAGRVEAHEEGAELHAEGSHVGDVASAAIESPASVQEEDEQASSEETSAAEQDAGVVEPSAADQGAGDGQPSALEQDAAPGGDASAAEQDAGSGETSTPDSAPAANGSRTMAESGAQDGGSAAAGTPVS
jgi:translation initiation factor IF-3